MTDQTGFARAVLGDLMVESSSEGAAVGNVSAGTCLAYKKRHPLTLGDGRCPCDETDHIASLERIVVRLRLTGLRQI
jgi:hypothetical protein